MPTNAPAPGLSLSQIQALEALVTGSPIADAAKAAGVHRCTVHTWCRDNRAFRAALADTKRMHAESVQDHFRSLVESASAGLRKIVESDDTPTPVRLKAILAVLNFVATHDPVLEAKSAGGVSTEGYNQFLDAMENTVHDRRALDAALNQPAERIPAQATATVHPAPPVQPNAPAELVARGSPCPCGSRQKYKRCCGINSPGITDARAA